MAKGTRVNILAKELGVESKVILQKLKDEGLGDKAPNHMSTLPLGLAESVREWFSTAGGGTAVETAPHVEVSAKQKAARSRKIKEESEAVEPDSETAAPAAAAVIAPVAEAPVVAPPAPAPAVVAPVAAPPAAVKSLRRRRRQRPRPRVHLHLRRLRLFKRRRQRPASAACTGSARCAAGGDEARRGGALRAAGASRCACAGAGNGASSPDATDGDACEPRRVPACAGAEAGGAGAAAYVAGAGENPGSARGSDRKAGSPGAARPRPAARQTEPPEFNPAVQRAGRGVKATDEEDEDAKKKAAGKKSGSLSSRRRGGNDGRRGEAMEKIKEFTDADLIAPGRAECRRELAKRLRQPSSADRKAGHARDRQADHRAWRAGHDRRADHGPLSVHCLGREEQRHYLETDERRRLRHG